MVYPAKKCCLCGHPIAVEANGWSDGHNAAPVSEGRCCETCNYGLVVPTRLSMGPSWHESSLKSKVDVSVNAAQLRCTTCNEQVGAMWRAEEECSSVAADALNVWRQEHIEHMGFEEGLPVLGRLISESLAPSSGVTIYDRHPCNEPPSSTHYPTPETPKDDPDGPSHYG